MSSSLRSKVTRPVFGRHKPGLDSASQSGLVTHIRPARHGSIFAHENRMPPVAEPKSLSIKAAVVGAGNTGRALSAYLANEGHGVNLLARNISAIPQLARQRVLTAAGKISGKFQLDNVGSDAKKLLGDSEYIFVTTVTHAYSAVAAWLAPHINRQHKVVLFSSKLCGSLEFEQALKMHGCRELPPVVETDALFVCRAQADESVAIPGFKQWTLFSGTNASNTRDFSKLITKFFPQLTPAANLIQRGLTDFGALAHVPIVLANMNAIDRKEPFLFYHQGMTEKTVAILETIESEFRAIASAYGATLIPMKDLLNRYYGCDNSSLLTAMKTVVNYKDCLSPASLDQRFLIEDVFCTLVPATLFASLAGIRTPAIDSMVTLASILTGIDFRQDGRTLNKLGFAGMPYERVFRLMNA